jgi:gamma-glutamylcyclotransferase (GGCT)/AIG2-like uncharacterized protein YtfP
VSERAAESVFVYGTLTVPRVMRAVTGREFDLLPASLPGYACFRVRGAAYPGVVLARLDRFEGRVYERRRVTVRVEPDERREAWAWVIRPEHRSLLSNEPWNRERFVRHDLPSFLRDEG